MARACALPVTFQAQVHGVMSDTSQLLDVCGQRAPARHAAPDDRFFRQIVHSMRNGVIALKRDGTLALMNDEAYRIFALTRVTRSETIAQSERRSAEDVQGRRAAVAAAVSAVPERAGKVAAVVVVAAAAAIAEQPRMAGSVPGK